MKIRTRLSLAFLLLGGASIYWLVNWVVEDLRSRYLAAMEEAMASGTFSASAEEVDAGGTVVTPQVTTVSAEAQAAAAPSA